MRTLAALAAIPSRAHLLPDVLRALRPQVDALCVYLNGYDVAPECVRDLCDDHVLDTVNNGAERKLHWADKHEGLYLSCDDDLLYPPDYAAAMRGAVEAWGGGAIAVVHGREYEGTPSTVNHVVPGSVGTFMRNVPCGRLVNHGGTGVMAWDTRRVSVPTQWPQKNIADMQVAIWAQRQRVPMYLLAHEANWIKLLHPTEKDGLWQKSMRENHARRNELLRTHVWYRWREAA